MWQRDNKWCCPSSNVCGETKGQCCNSDKTLCCPSGQKSFAVVGVDQNGIGGGYKCCSEDSTGAVRGNNWGSVFEYCCENGTIPMEEGPVLISVVALVKLRIVMVIKRVVRSVIM